jgi:hypothetical protein
MASFYGYVVLLLGLSLLLGMAGADTAGGNLLNKFLPMNVTSPTENYSVDSSRFYTSIDPTSPANMLTILGDFFTSTNYLIVVGIIIAVYAGLVLFKGVSGGIFGIAESTKILLLVGFLPIMIADFAAIFNYLNGLDMIMSGVIKILAFIIYVPIAIGLIISAFDFVGGGR